MFEVKRNAAAKAEGKKFEISIYRGTARERKVVFEKKAIAFRELPPEIAEELASENPRLVAEEIQSEPVESDGSDGSERSEGTSSPLAGPVDPFAKDRL